MALVSVPSDPATELVDLEEPDSGRPPSPEALARVDAAFAAAPRWLMEELEEAERLDKLVK